MSDNNYQSYADQDGLTIRNLVIDPKAAGANVSLLSDVWKLSHVTNSTFDGVTVIALGAMENALDANRMCSNVAIRNCWLVGGRQAAIVTKGGCRGMIYEDIFIQAEDSARVDILWDDWSDQSSDHSEGTFIRCRRAGDAVRLPLRLAFGRWHRPTFIDSPYVVDWPLTVGMHCYNILKGLGRKLGL